MSMTKNLSVLGIAALAMVLILVAVAAPKIRIRFEVERLAGDAEAFAEAVQAPEGTISHRALLQLLTRADGRVSFFLLLWSNYLSHDFGLKYSGMGAGDECLWTKSGLRDEDTYRRQLLDLLPHVYRTPFSPPDYSNFEITALPTTEATESFLEYVQKDSPESLARMRRSLNRPGGPEWYLRIRRLHATEIEEAPRFMSG